jgi:hypothetical protein
MWKTCCGLAFASLIVAAIAAPTAHAQTLPLEMMQTAYEHISKDQWRRKDDPADVTNAPKTLTAKWFTARFIGALQKNAKCWASGKEGSVISVWFNGQDYEIKEFKVASVSSSTNKETIRAEFVNLEESEKRDFLFQKTSSGWRIDDVLDKGQSLYALMIKGCAG